MVESGLLVKLRRIACAAILATALQAVSAQASAEPVVVRVVETRVSFKRLSAVEIAAYLASDARWPIPGDQYVIDVARVLQRALPPHMPEPERFVV